MPRPPRRFPPPGRARVALAVVVATLTCGVLAFGLALGVGRLLGGTWSSGPAATAAAGVLVSAPLSAWIGTVITRRVRGHLAVTDRVECGLRVLAGHQDGLTRRWRPGLATLAPGRVTFVATVGGVRFLRRRPVTFEVATDGPTLPRRIRGVEALLVGPEARAVRLTTPSAVLEWAVTAEDVPWAVQRVGTP